MTVTAAQPSLLTVGELREMFARKAPEHLPKFDQVKADLTEPSGATKLSELIQKPVETDTTPENIIYRWTGRDRAFEMKVPLPGVQTGVDARLFGREKDAAEDGAVSEPKGDPKDKPGAHTTTSQNAPEPPTRSETPPSDFFDSLAEIVGDDTFFMTLCGNGSTLRVTLDRTDKEDGDPFDALCLEGTPAELTASFGNVLRARAKAQHDFAAQVAAIKDADDALVKAKQKEADAKKKKADKKEASAEKEEKKAEADKAQQSIF